MRQNKSQPCQLPSAFCNLGVLTKKQKDKHATKQCNTKQFKQVADETRGERGVKKEGGGGGMLRKGERKGSCVGEGLRGCNACVCEKTDKRTQDKDKDIDGTCLCLCLEMEVQR